MRKFRNEIVRDIADRYGYTITSMNELYSQIVEYFKEELRKGTSFTIPGLFSFNRKFRPGRQTYDLQSGCVTESRSRWYTELKAAGKLKLDCVSIVEDGSTEDPLNPGVFGDRPASPLDEAEEDAE